MTGVELVEAERHVALFPGATPEALTEAATDVANRFSDIVKQKRLFKRIGDRDHVLIEGWQTVGTLVGVFATEAGGVRELPWPTIGPLPDEPADPGPEPRQKQSAEHDEWAKREQLHGRWRHHRTLLDAKAMGGAFGFTATFVARKDGRDIGWGEGRVDRFERTWASRENYAISSMAQTRGQSRALAAPLKWIVKLAGYETTPAEEMNGDEPAAAPAAAGDSRELEELRRELELTREHPFGPWADDKLQEQAAKAIQHVLPGVDGFGFVLALGTQLNGVPEVVARSLRSLAHWASTTAGTGSVRAHEDAEMAPPDPADSAYHNSPEDQR